MLEANPDTGHGSENCTCTRKTHYDTDGYPMRDSYGNTVECDRSSGTESGSFYYHCTRCGKGAWSGL